MFMFNNTLVGRLFNWKQGDEEDIWRSKALEVLVKKVTRAGQNQNLKLSLHAKRENTPCVTLDRSKDGRLQVMHRKMLPHVMYCRIFRWPDLQSQHELRSIPTCNWPAHQREMTEICVNPYHYLRVEHSNFPPVVTPRNNEFTNAVASPQPHSPMSTESNYSSQQQSPPLYLSPAAYQMPPHQQDNPNDSLNYFTGQTQLQNSSQPISLTAYHTNQPTSVEANGWFGRSNGLSGHVLSEENMQIVESEPRVHSSPLPAYSAVDQRSMILPMETNDNTKQDSWCRIFYNELNQKVGAAFESGARVVIVDGFTCPRDHNRFSLCQLSNINRSKAIEQVRNCIGEGIKIENDGTQIHVTNMSAHSIFFCSKNCNVENQLNQHSVVKLEAGKSYKMFDHKIFEDLLQEALKSEEEKKFERLFSLIEHCIIKLSFTKGWGSLYKRQDVSSTPCWIDIHLLKYYELIDQYLPQVKPSTRVTSTS